MSTQMTTDGRARVLADGSEMPMVGLGVWQVEKGDEAENAVRWALELGYRHIDTAQAYGNEESVGRALRESGVPREEVFITTKFFPRSRSGDPAKEIEKSLERLGVDQVDLYLVHWPENGPLWAWEGMQKAHEAGHARAIGISNFNVDEVDAVLAEASVKPVVNQIQISPVKHRTALIEQCERNDIAVEAYSPLNSARLDDPALTEVAERVGRTPAQVILRWCVEHDMIVIPKSVRRERLEENGPEAIFGFELSDDDVKAIDALDETGGTGEAQEGKWW